MSSSNIISLRGHHITKLCSFLIKPPERTEFVNVLNSLGYNSSFLNFIYDVYNDILNNPSKFVIRIASGISDDILCSYENSPCNLRDNECAEITDLYTDEPILKRYNLHRGDSFSYEDLIHTSMYRRIENKHREDIFYLTES